MFVLMISIPSIGSLIRILNVKCFCLFRFSFGFDKNSAMCRSRCNFISFPKQDGMENVCCCCLQSVQISTSNLFLILHLEFISVGMFSTLTQFVADANTKSSSANSNQTLEPTLGTQKWQIRRESAVSDGTRDKHDFSITSLAVSVCRHLQAEMKIYDDICANNDREFVNNF